jgi:hypothetical protein
MRGSEPRRAWEMACRIRPEAIATVDEDLWPILKPLGLEAFLANYRRKASFHRHCWGPQSSGRSRCADVRARRPGLLRRGKMHKYWLVRVERRPDANGFVAAQAWNRIPDVLTDERLEIFEACLVKSLKDDVVLALTQGRL